MKYSMAVEKAAKLAQPKHIAFGPPAAAAPAAAAAGVFQSKYRVCHA
jgi:hypothetical protein